MTDALDSVSCSATFLVVVLGSVHRLLSMRTIPCNKEDAESNMAIQLAIEESRVCFVL